MFTWIRKFDAGWTETPPAVRISLICGVLLTVTLAVLTLVFPKLAIGTRFIRRGIQTGYLAPHIFSNLALVNGAVFLCPGFVIGTGAAVWAHADLERRPTWRTMAGVLSGLVVIPTVSTVCLGLLGFLGIFLFLLIDAGAVTAVLFGLFFGALVFGASLVAAVALVFVVSVTAGAGIVFGHVVCTHLQSEPHEERP